MISCSAKQLVRGEPNVSYICSRYYRAPELIFGATDYTSQIGSVPKSLAVLGVLVRTCACQCKKFENIAVSSHIVYLTSLELLVR